MEDSLKGKAIKALRAFAPKRYPQNIMRGCAECGSDVKDVHKPSCKWQRAQEVIKALES
jgi:hypothetical protein